MSGNNIQNESVNSAGSSNSLMSGRGQDGDGNDFDGKLAGHMLRRVADMYSQPVASQKAWSRTCFLVAASFSSALPCSPFSASVSAACVADRWIHDTRARLAESHDRPAVVHAFTVLTGREDGGNDWAGRVLFMLETCLIAGLTNLLYEVWGKGGGGEGEVMG